MKFRFKKYGHDLTGDYCETNFNIGQDWCYVLIAQDETRHKKPRMYYAIDLEFLKLSKQIRDSRIITKEDAVNRVKSELFTYINKIYAEAYTKFIQPPIIC